MSKGKPDCWVCGGEGLFDVGDTPEDRLECGCVDLTEEEFQASDYQRPPVVDLDHVRAKGAEIAAYLQANAAPCLPGCLCRICGGDPAKQAPDEARAGT